MDGAGLDHGLGPSRRARLGDLGQRIDAGDYLTPVESEEQHYRRINVQYHPLPGELALH